MDNKHLDPTPLYARIESALAANIIQGTLPAGTQLPNEDRLIQQFDVSRTTVRKAIQNLVNRNLVEIRRGKGTFAVQPKIAQELTELSGFVEDMQALGRNPTARLIDKQIVAADTTIARQLALAPGTSVMRIQRIRLADGVAMSFDETYLPLAIGEKIVTHDLEAEPIFTLLEQKYNIPLVEAEYRLEAVSAESIVAESLGIAIGSPVFLIERTSYRQGNTPIDYEKLYYRGDLIQFVTRLTRRAAAKR
jgi:GntR family transcriptional regulator